MIEIVMAVITKPILVGVIKVMSHPEYTCTKIYSEFSPVKQKGKPNGSGSSEYISVYRVSAIHHKHLIIS